MRFKKLKTEELEEEIRKIEEYIDNLNCIKCNSPVVTVKSQRDLVRCTFKSCYVRYMKWKNTIFESIKISKVKVLQVIQQWMVKSSQKQISFNLDISLNCVSIILKRLRKVLVDKYLNKREKIGGKDVIVEIDESKFGKRKYNKGHKVEGVWVLGLVERTGEKRIKLITLKDRSKITLIKLIKKHVHRESIIFTDGWKGYIGLDKYFAGHSVVNHSLHFVDPDTSVHTNTIEGNWCGVKLQIPHKNRTKKKIYLYLIRYMLLKDTKTHPLLLILKYLF
jgi:transposase-like protein